VTERVVELNRVPAQAPSEFERTPPQDNAAEQSVLGGMLLNKDAIADVVEIVRSQDFYRPAHQIVFDVVLDLYGRGEPVDAITVGAELTKNGDAGRVGGLPYLHTLVSTVPTAANAGYYAKIVAELAILRRLVEAGTRIVQLGYSAEGSEVDDIVDRAQQAIYDVTERRTSEDYTLLSDLMSPTMDELETIGGRNGLMSGVPTGFHDLDQLTNGLHPGQMIVIAGRPGLGKALALDTPLPTPMGWTTMGEVRVGEQLLGADGKPTTVVAATEVLLHRPCYEVGFSDGTCIVADAMHQWLTTAHGVTAIRTTDELAVDVGAGHLVPRPEGLHLWGQHEARTSVVPDERSVVAVRRVVSVPVRCVEVDNEDHLYLASEGFVPTHNSTLGLDIARSASIKHGQASVIFSLEMSKTEITMRLLSAEARVALNHMRTGSMTDDDWARLARRMGEVAEAPLYIDDSPNLTMMEIRAKARRLKQRHDLKLVVIDYLQLMQGNKRSESRQQEVSEISRALKLLAKELEVPVIAMSQLNRGAEQRTDKKPQLSDLRESGCLPASARVLRADTGAETTMGELFATGARDVPVWSLDSSLRYVRRHLTHVFSTGTKPVFRLRLASGKTVRATANHPFLTYDGWRALEELVPGTRVAVPRHVPAPENETVWTDDRVALEADRFAAGFPLPEEAFALPKSDLRRLLRRALMSLRLETGDLRRFALRHVTSHQASRLLLRFGVACSLEPAGPLTDLVISEPADVARFQGQIESGLDGEAASDAVHEELRGLAAGQVSDAVWQELHAAMSSPTMSPAGRLTSVATALLGEDLELEATNDVFWDLVVEVVPDGVEEVFDATVVGNHNFVADGIAVHNSIEQDADLVMLLHREDAYEKESPRAGEADFIVAKHRNGPTATITVAFQGHYSRFVDMSPA
jgi:replicative DNA helicase